MRVIGYAYEADVHCEGCAIDRFGHGVNEATDSEGNEVHPIHDIDEYLDDNGEPATYVCGDCREEFD